MFRFAPARRREAETVDPPLTDLTAGEKVVVVGGSNSSTTTRSREWCFIRVMMMNTITCIVDQTI